MSCIHVGYRAAMASASSRNSALSCELVNAKKVK
uniref:Uncharacterized protein n=1 Tax=Arundo donax TaxID=35708 RepID=A0A0A9EPG3_ARUDO